MKIVVYTRTVKEMAKFPKKQRDAIEKAWQVLADWPPEHADIKKLAGRPDYRLRVGRYRVVFEVNEAEGTIVITHVVIRDDRTYS